jgi:riboflavin kinase/FMN adenylyltransferase
MKIVEELQKIKPQQETMFTIGVFDGVHLGHQSLLSYLKEKAHQNGWLSGVITFISHPETVLGSQNQLPWLDSLENRIELIKSMGIEIVIALNFTAELRQLSARDFVQLLKEHLKLRGLIVGPDFALGKNRQGNVEQLHLLGKQMGFDVEVVPPLIVNGEVVSSSLIRQVLAQGDMKRTANLLGRPFKIRGLVVPGDHRGRTLGFPTANIDIKPGQASPGDGVYVTIAYTDSKPLPSVTNIGIRPTFGGGQRMVETYIINHKAELSGKTLSVTFIDKLRDEKRFTSSDELKTQITRDVEQEKLVLREIM